MHACNCICKVTITYSLRSDGHTSVHRPRPTSRLLHIFFGNKNTATKFLLCLSLAKCTSFEFSQLPKHAVSLSANHEQSQARMHACSTSVSLCLQARHLVRIELQCLGHTTRQPRLEIDVASLLVLHVRLPLRGMARN